MISFGAAVRAWFAISLQTFGGPAGQIAVMQRELVEERRWIGQRRFLHALSFCLLLPGPEAHQLAVYTGWLLHGVRGGVVAGVLFVLPGLLAMLVLSVLYVGLGDTTVVGALFTGLGAAVVPIVAQAVVRLGRRALHQPLLVGLAVAAFLALAVVGVPFPVVIGVAGLLGWFASRRVPAMTAPGTNADADSSPVVPEDTLHAEAPSGRRAARRLVGGLLVWLAPLLLVAVTVGPDSIYPALGLFFAGAALVTFGGAYAVLAFVAQQAVQVHGWVTAADMARGLALAETTPGPLIMVVQFVGFVAAHADSAPLSPWVGAVLASLLVTWVTFVPSFLFIFLGAPYVERLRHHRALAGALAGISAAVVGVIANLAVYVAVTTLFAAVRPGPLALLLPDLSTVRPVPLAIAGVAAVLIFALRWSMLRTLGVCAVLGLAAGLAGLPLG